VKVDFFADAERMMNAAKESAAKENIQQENEDQDSYSEEDDEKDQPVQHN
jgi:hypothetical protein